MSRVGTKNTKPELIVRRRLHSVGPSISGLHRRDLPGSPTSCCRPERQSCSFMGASGMAVRTVIGGGDDRPRMLHSGAIKLRLIVSAIWALKADYPKWDGR